MRNAAVPFDDFAPERPTRKPVARKPRADAKRAGGRAKSRIRYAHYAAVGLSAAVALGIVVNALALQHSRHPAPLFGQAIQLGGAPAPAAPSPAAEPVKGTERTDLAPAPVAAPVAAQPAPAPRPRHAVEAPSPPSKAKGDDPIARLLKTSAGLGGDKGAPGDRPGDAKTVLAAQHALTKLGFAVKATGSYGPATRAAIETFERDQHLPVKGEMSRRLLKRLSADSGVAID